MQGGRRTLLALARLPLLWRYDTAMRTVSALDLRRHFGRILDETAAGERIVIERAGEPIAALVPLEDLAVLDPERVKRRRLEALDELGRLIARSSRPPRPPGNEVVRAARRERTRRLGARPGRRRI
jgi:prevent-host-death family protein